MHKFLKENRITLINILLTMLLTIGLPLYWAYIYATLVDLPISLSPSGSVITQFTVPRGTDYVLEFTFEREGFSNESLQELIGNNFQYKKEVYTDEKLQKAVGNRQYKTQNAGEYISVKTGTPISIRYEIRSLNSNSLIQQEIETIGKDSWGAKSVNRFISEFPSPIPNYTMPKFYLSSGKYEFKATILNDVPALSGFKTNILLSPSPSKDDFVFKQLIWLALIVTDVLLVIFLAINVWSNRIKTK